MPKSLTYYLAIAFVLTACGKDENLINTESSMVVNFLNQAYVDDMPCDSLGGGVWRVLENERDERSSQQRLGGGGTADIYFEGYVLNATLNLSPAAAPAQRPAPFYTNVQAYIDALRNGGFTDIDWSAEPLEITIGGGQLMKSLERGLDGAFEGDSLLVMMTSDRGFGDRPMGVVSGNAPLIYRVYINDVR